MRKHFVKWFRWINPGEMESIVEMVLECDIDNDVDYMTNMGRASWSVMEFGTWDEAING